MTDRSNSDARATAERIARASYGKLVAILASRYSDIAGAEDALSDAFAAALSHWPKTGIPENPEAWLITTAQNRQKDKHKAAYVKTNAGSLDDENFEMTAGAIDLFEFEQSEIPDKRLQLLFACAHPAIDATIHTPLMLQAVLGLEASQIASAYLMPSATLAQRLVRAKRKIKTAKIPFALPQTSNIPERLNAVLEAIYGAFSVDWSTAAAQEITKDLSTEAIYLASLIVDLMPDEPEALGLAALLAFSNARRQARTTESGQFVPLENQDVQRWDRLAIRRGQSLLKRAAQHKQPGRFQLEAAIQSVHAERLDRGEIDWRSIAQLYEGLIAVASTSGAMVARAAAVGNAYGAQAGINALRQINEDEMGTFQPFWATKAHLMEMSGNKTDAIGAYEKAVSLCTDNSIRIWLEGKMLEIRNSNSAR